MPPAARWGNFCTSRSPSSSARGRQNQTPGSTPPRVCGVNFTQRDLSGPWVFPSIMSELKGLGDVLREVDFK